MKLRQTLLLAALIPLLASAPAVAWQGGKKETKEVRKQRDHDLARQAVLRREVLPLTRILALAARYQPGEVIEIEVKARQGTIFYDVHVLIPSGVVHELFIDAKSGRLIVNQVKRD
ncbi:PepSY domain-containing protein [Sphingomonas sp. MG17]|uniref:PepSY domain-containing protein n=1 Tax=Sphingomonas tagetis TaxID=2949092 RepID=A0A9X2HR25_9SPHN|nr:PepSY domain-containing protein [Sphingomonas tagetis]MCP3731030.1 PepSY domain-containing protein [Sphingomonas tagetis]